eukprot:s2237_g3.t1
MTTAGVSRDIITYNATLSSLQKAGQSQKASELFDSMPVSQVSPDLISYNTTISACEKSGHWQRGLQLLQGIRSGGFRPDVISYSAAISCCEKATRWMMALRLLNEMPHESVPPNSISYNAGISACEKGGPWQFALRLLAVMPHCRLSPTVVSYSATLSSVEKRSLWQFALKIFEDMSEAKVTPNSVSYRVALSSFQKAGQWQLCLQLLQALPREDSPDLYAYSLAMSCCERAHHWEASIQIWESLWQAKVTPDTVCLNACITSCFRGLWWQQAINLLHTMPRAQVAVDVVSYNAAMTACTRGKLWQLALQLHSTMLDAKMSPDVVTYSALLDCVVSSNEDAFRVPVTDPPPTPPPSSPTFPPEVGEVDPSIFATAEPTTSWRPQGPFAGLWDSVRTDPNDVSVGQLYERTDLNFDANEEIPRAPIPGAQLAFEKCPPYAERFWDPLSPPAGIFICELKQTCGKMPPILACLFITGGLLCANILALCGMGCASQGGFDVTAAFCSVGLLPIALISHIVALVLAADVGLSPPAFQMTSVGAVCAIVSLLLVILATLLAIFALVSNLALEGMNKRAEEATRVAQEYDQANLEATEEWRLQKDREKAEKKPKALGWRSKKVLPEDALGLEDQKKPPRASTPPSEVATSVGSSAGSPRGPLQASVLAIGDVPSQPEAIVQVVPEQRLSVALRSVHEVAPSPATESCMRSFINSPEGAVYAQRCAQPSTVPNTAREVSEWVPKVSRSNGMLHAQLHLGFRTLRFQGFGL